MSVVFTQALLVEDEPHLAQTVALALSKLGIAVEHVSSLRKAREALKRKPQDLVILDRGLPDGDGLSLCRELDRKRTHVLILSALGGTLQRVEGLDAGADDYLPKPFSFTELEARIRALSRRARSDAPSPAADPLWTLDPSRLRALGPRGWKDLTPLEFRFLERLVRSESQIVSRDLLLKEVWGFSLLPKTRTVDQFLARMRRYFEADPDQPVHFLTSRGAGYVFRS